MSRVLRRSSGKTMPNINVDPIDRLICAVLRGESAPWPESSGREFAEAFLQRNNYHGVLGLLSQKLDGAESWPAPVRHGIHSYAIVQAIWERQHKELLTRLLSAFTGAGIRPIVLKGTALAYSLYPDP